MKSFHGLVRIPTVCEKIYSFVLNNRKFTMQIKHENGCIIFVWGPKKCQFQQAGKIWPEKIKADCKKEMI